MLDKDDKRAERFILAIVFTFIIAIAVIFNVGEVIKRNADIRGNIFPDPVADQCSRL